MTRVYRKIIFVNHMSDGRKCYCTLRMVCVVWESPAPLEFCDHLHKQGQGRLGVRFPVEVEVPFPVRKSVLGILFINPL